MEQILTDEENPFIYGLSEFFESAIHMDALRADQKFCSWILDRCGSVPINYRFPVTPLKKYTIHGTDSMTDNQLWRHIGPGMILDHDLFFSILYKLVFEDENSGPELGHQLMRGKNYIMYYRVADIFVYKVYLHYDVNAWELHASLYNHGGVAYTGMVVLYADEPPGTCSCGVYIPNQNRGIICPSKRQNDSPYNDWSKRCSCCDHCRRTCSKK